MLLASMKVITDPYMPGPYQFRFPEKGPYYRRRQKKFRKDMRNWKWPDEPLVIFGGNTIFCNPGYLPVLEDALQRQGVQHIVY